jgi:hypothetical protein
MYNDVRRTDPPSIFLGAVVAIALGSVGANASPFAYESTSSDQWGTIDLGTGAFTQLGTSAGQLSGLGEVGGNIYGGLSGSSTLYRINPTDGALTSIGSDLGISYFDTGSTTSGLFAISFLNPSDLYQINPLTGTATDVGPLGITIQTAGVFTGMSTNSSALYITTGTRFYSVNTSTGQATLIGSTDGPQIGAMVMLGGTLYGGSDPANQVYTLDTTSGAAGFVANVTNGASEFYGLAPLTATPLPSTWTMMLIGLASIGLIAHRRQKRAADFAPA